MNDELYTVLPINGSFLDILDPGTEFLRYDCLTWEEAVELCRISFLQGYQLVIWQQADTEEEDSTEGGTGECGKKQTETSITN